MLGFRRRVRAGGVWLPVRPWWWFRMWSYFHIHLPRWLFWITYRPRRCMWCNKLHWAGYYIEYCSGGCANADSDQMGQEANQDRMAGI